MIEENRAGKLPERLQYLEKVNNFLAIITEEAKEDKMSQREFLEILMTKCRSMVIEEKMRVEKLADNY